MIHTIILIGSITDSAQTLNAAELAIGGVASPSELSSDLPTDARLSLRGCFEAPRFITYSITSQPPPLLNFDTQIRDSRYFPLSTTATAADDADATATTNSYYYMYDATTTTCTTTAAATTTTTATTTTSTT